MTNTNGACMSRPSLALRSDRRKSPRHRLEDADAPCWSEAERAMIAAVNAPASCATLTDAEYKALSAHYDDDQILESFCFAASIAPCRIWRTPSRLRWRTRRRGFRCSCHCEERSDEASRLPALPDCFAALAMTKNHATPARNRSCRCRCRRLAGFGHDQLHDLRRVEQLGPLRRRAKRGRSSWDLRS